MDTTVEKKFQAMGARVKISEPKNTWRTSQPFSIDIRRDKAGEFFDIQVQKEIELMVLDVQKDDRHLLLMTKNHSPILTRSGTLVSPADPQKARFLCGHDERNWFTCAVPGGASNVFQAKQALKPVILQDIEAREGLKTSRAHKRHRKLNSGRKIHRQGEFMFIPEPGFQPPVGSLVKIWKHEPMSRGNTRVGNSHFAEYLYRSGGEKVYVASEIAPNGFTEKEYRNWLKAHPDEKWRRFDVRVRNARVLVKGKITHKEHKTLDLGETVWHRVAINTENLAVGARAVAFLD
jgi:hypothetical protein